jgi:uncharacterized protein (DUF1501 family)
VSSAPGPDVSVSKRHSATTSARGYVASGTWLDESHALLDAASPLDRLDPGPIERVHPTLGTLDVEAVSQLAETLGTVFAGMHEALEQLGEQWRTVVAPTLAAFAEQFRKVDAARRRPSPDYRAARGRPADYPAPPTRMR